MSVSDHHHRSDFTFTLIWTVIVPGLIGLLIAFIAIRAWQTSEPNDGVAASQPVNLQQARQDLQDGRDVAAAQLFATLAKQGDPNAQYWLGHLTEAGIGTKRDVQKAIELYKQAADHQVVPAEVRLGEIYLRGNLAVPDTDLAQTYLDHAAEQGNARAAMLLGQLYRSGVGRTSDLVEAYAWSEVATVEGSRFAEGQRDALLRALGPKSQQAGVARAKQILAGIKRHAQPD